MTQQSIGAKNPMSSRETERNDVIGAATAEGTVAVDSWHRQDGKMDGFPSQEYFLDPTNERLRRTIVEKVLPGWLPKGSIFQRGATLVTLGSCFSRELQQAMRRNQEDLQHLWMPSGLNNTFAMRQFFEWVLEGNTSSDAYWYDQHDKGGATKWTPKEERDGYLEAFQATAGFVLTLGLSEVWTDKATGGVFWRGVPERIFDPERHEFRLSTVQENRENIIAITNLIKKHCGDAPVIFSLSPVPLRATFREESCFTADSVSKATLRVAVDEAVRELRSTVENVYYWPSFEIVRWLPAHMERATFGAEGKSRDVDRPIVDLIICTFLDFFFEPGVSDSTEEGAARSTTRRVFASDGS